MTDMKDTEKTVAVIEDGVVVNVIVVDTTKPRATSRGELLVEYDEKDPACIGLTYDPDTGFEQHPIPEQEASDE